MLSQIPLEVYKTLDGFTTLHSERRKQFLTFSKTMSLHLLKPAPIKTRGLQYPTTEHQGHLRGY